MATYYVSLAGDNAGPGTIGEPFATLAYALTQTGTNDTVLVRQGDTFTGVVYNKIYTSGLTLSNYDGGAGTANPIFDHQLQGDYTYSAVIDVNAQNVTVDGIDVHRCMGRGIYFDNGSDGGVARNCHTKLTALNGLLSRGCDNITFEDNIVEDASQIRLDKGQTFASTWPPAVGFLNTWNSVARRNQVIRGEGEGIDCYYGSSHCVVEDNIISGNRRVALFVDGSEYITIRRNLVYYTGEDISGRGTAEWAGILLSQERDYSTSPVTINNIVVENNLISGYATGLALTSRYDITDYHGTIIRNNIFTACNVGFKDIVDNNQAHPAGSIQIYNNLFTGNLKSDEGFTSNVTKDYNCWWPAPINNGGPNDVVASVVLTRTSGWTDGPQGGITAADFMPVDGSANWGAGTDAGQTTDYYNNEYLSPWDIGAFSSNAVPPDPEPPSDVVNLPFTTAAAGAATISDGEVSGGNEVSASVYATATTLGDDLYAVATQSATPPSAADIIAGVGIAAASVPVTVSGRQGPIVLTGLDVYEDYYAHIVQDTTPASNILTAPFQTANVTLVSGGVLVQGGVITTNAATSYAVGTVWVKNQDVPFTGTDEEIIADLKATGTVATLKELMAVEISNATPNVINYIAWVQDTDAI